MPDVERRGVRRGVAIGGATLTFVLGAIGGAAINRYVPRLLDRAEAQVAGGLLYANSEYPWNGCGPVAMAVLPDKPDYDSFSPSQSLTHKLPLHLGERCSIQRGASDTRLER